VDKPEGRIHHKAARSLLQTRITLTTYSGIAEWHLVKPNITVIPANAGIQDA
jgi:hypothetical protein